MMLIIMGMAQARIGKIRLKAGGAEVRVLNRAVRSDGENWRGLIVRHAREIAEHQPRQEMVGFVIVAMFSDGGYSSSSRMDADATIGRTLLPSYVAEVVRRDVLIEPIADGEI